MTEKPQAPPEELHYTVKTLAAAIEHSEDFVGDMKKGGFRLPGTKTQAEQFIRDHGPVRKYRNRTRLELYGHPPAETARPSCGTGAPANKQTRRSRH